MIKNSELFATGTDPELLNWLQKCENPTRAVQEMNYLFAKLNTQNIFGTVEEGATIIGNVHLGERSVIRAGALLRGPVVIGDDVEVDSLAYIGPYAFVAPRCSIGASTILRNCVILQNVAVGPSALVSNCIIGAGALIGSAARIGLMSAKADTPRNCALGIGIADGACIPAGEIVES